MKDKIKDARRELRAFRSDGVVSYEGPTPERLVQGGGFHRVLEASKAEEVIGEDGRPTTAILKSKHFRMANSPLARLVERKMLAPSDKFLNLTLGVAGDRYYELWYNGGSSPLGAIDPSKPQIQNASPPAWKQTAWQLEQWQEWLAASMAIWPAHRAVVEAVVLHEREPLEVGRAYCGYSSRDQATAVALDRLKFGLGELAKHFGILERRGWVVGQFE